MYRVCDSESEKSPLKVIVCLPGSWNWNLAYEPCISQIQLLFSSFTYTSSTTIWTHGLLVMLSVLTLFLLFHTCFISYSKLTACRRIVYSVHPFLLENSTGQTLKLWKYLHETWTMIFGVWSNLCRKTKIVRWVQI